MSEIYLPEDDSYLMSEVLKIEIQKLLEQNKNIKFLEIGCGSGIQLQTALKIGINKKNIFSGDINKEAVKHCKSLGFNSVYSDLFSAFKGKVVSGKPRFSHKFDIIIFNPPYLPKDANEPPNSRIATTGGKKGSELINRFLKQSKEYLTEKGKIFLLTSSLTDGINFRGYDKKLIAEKKLFFEKLQVWELSLPE